RSRLKKDYDDFKRHPELDKFTRELWSNDESEADSGKDSFAIVTSKCSESAEHVEIPQKDHSDNEEVKLLEMSLPAGKSRLLKKDSTAKEIQKTLPKSVKRQSKQNSCLDQSTNELSPRKKAKLSTSEAVIHSPENNVNTDSGLTEPKYSEASSPPESNSPADPATSISNILKGTKPVQALLAKNTGNKVTLTSQLSPSPSISISASEKPIVSPLESSSIKPALPCQTISKNPLQMIYKMPNGHCIPIDLHNSSVKIQMQPVIDPKTGEKVMQQVLILPKNVLIQQKDGKTVSKDIQSLQQKLPELHCTGFSQVSNINVSLTPVLVTAPTNPTIQPPSAILSKSITQLSQVADPLNRTQPLPSVTPAGNLLSAAITVSQTESDKTKTTVSAATLPVSLSSHDISIASEPLVSAATLSASANTASVFHSLTTQQATDSRDTRQELKTVCIRESQSILVTTRGGNTGIVKVQTNPEQFSPNSLSPTSVFTYAPQLQAFLVPKSTVSPSTLPSIATATSSLPNFGQSCVSGLASSTASTISIPAFPADLNQMLEKNPKFTLEQPTCGGTLGQAVEKNCHVSSPSLSSISSASTLSAPGLSAPSSPVNTVSIGQNNTVISPDSLVQQQGDIKTKKQPVIQSELNSATNGDVISGNAIQKLMLVTNPPILSPCGVSGINIIPSPASTGVSAQKLVLINTQIASCPSNTNVVAESLKHNLPSSLSKTFVGATEQPQLVLIPSTVGAPVRINSSPTVAQVKDVKIGLNIGQTIVNTKGNAHQAPPINVLQSAISKGEDKKNVTLSSGGGLVPACSSFVNQSGISVSESACIATKAATAFTVTTANAYVESVSVTPSGTSGTWPTVLIGGSDTSRIRPVLGNRLCTSNTGSAVGLSTVKTGHLASSVLISTTQPTVSPQNLPSALQFPVINLPGSVVTSPKVLPTIPQLAAVSAPPPVPPPPTLLQFQSSGISAAMPSNANIQKPQTLLPPASPNAGKVISFPNFSSLQCQQMPANIMKQTLAPTCASNTQTSAVSSPVTSKTGGQLNEPSIQQKIVINTCVPLAPGTQIMINGTCFVVPPQGLGAGSHVLLLSCNTKPVPSLTVNHGQEAQGAPVVTAVPSKTTLAPSNSLSWQTSKHPLKSATKIVNSFGSADALPIVHATPQVLTTPASSTTPPSAAPVSVSSVVKSPANVSAASSVVSAIQPGNSQILNNTSVFHLDTSIKKLLVSPEGAILNAINAPASKVSSLSSSLPSVVVSTSRDPPAVFPDLQSSCLDKPDKAA
ncbi:Uncharacterized protein KIAA2026, partial [Tinamus guttatus]